MKRWVKYVLTLHFLEVGILPRFDISLEHHTGKNVARSICESIQRAPPEIPELLRLSDVQAATMLRALERSR
jgi:hypothetical protein